MSRFTILMLLALGTFAVRHQEVTQKSFLQQTTEDVDVSNETEDSDTEAGPIEPDTSSEKYDMGLIGRQQMYDHVQGKSEETLVTVGTKHTSGYTEDDWDALYDEVTGDLNEDQQNMKDAIGAYNDFIDDKDDLVVEFERDIEDILLELEEVLLESGAYFAAGLVYGTKERFISDDQPPEEIRDRANPDSEMDGEGASDEETAAEEDNVQVHSLSNDQIVVAGLEEEFVLEASSDGMFSIENDLELLEVMEKALEGEGFGPEGVTEEEKAQMESEMDEDEMAETQNWINAG